MHAGYEEDYGIRVIPEKVRPKMEQEVETYGLMDEKEHTKLTPGSMDPPSG